LIADGNMKTHPKSTKVVLLRQAILFLALHIAFLMSAPYPTSGDTVQYIYDSLHRLVEIRYPDKIIRYTYDAAGNRTSEQVTNLNPLPTLASLTPDAVLARGSAFTLTVNGANFINGSTVQWNGTSRATTFVSSTRLTASIPAADIAADGAASVTVVTPEPGGGTSNALSLKIQLQPNPVPAVATLTPDAVTGPGAALTLTVNGSNFVDGSWVRWNGGERVTTFVSASKLTAALTEWDVAYAGVVGVTVSSPAPGGGLSNAASFTVNPPTGGYEADVNPRAGGNNAVGGDDWAQVGRFVVGLDAAAAGSEYQRADSAPKAGAGDGRITLADWVQAGRYAAKLDLPQAAGGPVAPAAAPAGESLSGAESVGPLAQSEMARTVRAVNTSFPRGQAGVLQIELDALGDEHALAFGLNFDPARLSFVEAKLNNSASGATLLVNPAQAASGRVGIALSLAAGQKFAPGTHGLMNVRFIPQGGSDEVTTQVSFGDQAVRREVADANAAVLAEVGYSPAAVLITGSALASVSAANYSGAESAAESIASAFGSELARTIEGATATPLPTVLGGTVVKVKDGAGVERAAPLFYVSPTQVNYQIPPDTAEGLATISVTNRDGGVSKGIAQIVKTSPGLFSADSTGRGLAAANVQRVKADGSQTFEPVGRFDAAQGQFVAAPIDLGPDSDQVFLVLYGTGVRHHGGLPGVTAQVGGANAEVTYAGAQPQFVGLDQINIRLPRSLAGRGEVDVVLTVGGKAANVVRVNIK
jgi:uncharacterized protein (TIGR03437 family)